ncbi:MAG: MurR/RpiR family transcriptional regulator, partial [Deltaproteobacteria bacterium]|nr:MurR/RpiR family transcriptional regulator [Deltaproteobacteria bacterium]
ASYLLNNHNDVAFLTATQLAQEIGVSQPTVIRFAQLLGFPRYHLFVEAFQSLLKAELTSADRFNLSLQKKHDIILREIRTLSHFARFFPQEAFDRAVEAINGSNRVAVIGTRGSSSLAQYFSYFLGKVKRRVCAITTGATAEFDTLLQMGKEDLAIALAFPRYPRETIELVEFCQGRDISVVGITDKVDAPLVSLSKLSVVIPITFSTIFDSYCSVLCLFNMMVTEVGRMNQSESAALLMEFEELARHLKIFV